MLIQLRRREDTLPRHVEVGMLSRCCCREVGGIVRRRTDQAFFSAMSQDRRGIIKKFTCSLVIFTSEVNIISLFFSNLLSMISASVLF